MLRVGSHLVVVVDEVDGMAVAIRGAAVPVIYHIVEQVESADGPVLSIHAAAHAPVAPGAVHQQVVVPRADAPVDGGSKAMVAAVGIVFVPGDAQCLADDTVLEGDVLSAAPAHGLVGAPGCGAMVHDGMVGTGHAHRVAGVLAIDAQSALEADMPADDIRPDVDVGSLDADALSGGCLSGDVGIGFREVRAEVEFDGAADIKHDVAWLVHHRQTVEQRAGLGAAAQRGDMIDHAAASADGIASVAFCLREGQMAGLERPDCALVGVAAGIHLVDAPPIALH